MSGILVRSPSNGKLQLIGLLNPNPLACTDMLGNVSEMMFHPSTPIKLIDCMASWWF